MKETACICLPCVKQIQRNHNNTEFTPRWLPKVPPKLKQSCNIEGCHTTVYSQTSLASPEELQLLFEKRVIAFSIESSKSTIGLCQDHYTQMYAHLRHPTPCGSCGAKPKKGKTHTRHCPTPPLINKYLNHVSTEASSLTAASKVCFTCYKYFMAILTELKSMGDILQQLESEDGQPSSSLGDIDSVIISLSTEIQALETKEESLGIAGLFELALCITAQTLATWLYILSTTHFSLSTANT